MDTITPEQELTLRNWVTAFGTKPGKREKVFLQKEKGLSERQIDSWLEKSENSQYHEASFRETASFPQGYQPTNDAGITGNLTSYDEVDMSNFNDDFISIIPPFSTVLDFGQCQLDFPCISPIDLSTQTQAWPLESFPGHSNFPSSADYNSSSSKSYNAHWTYMSGSDRSSSLSYGSSRTWDTASTVASFTEQEITSQEDLKFNSKKLTKGETNHLPVFSCNTIAEEPHLPIKPTSHHQIGTKQDKPVSKGPSRMDKGSGKYRCTACNCAFSGKWEWKRHEEAQHEPQTYWTCMLGDAAIATLTGWACVFCDSTETDRASMVDHLVGQHKINQCVNKPIANKTWTREDKLKQHLQQVHALSDESDRWKAWQYPAQRRAAWGCGYCGACSFTWEGRLNHIAEHYEGESLFGAQWSTNLVIKGLLKQCQPGFNVAKAWKELVGGASNSDRLLIWSSKDAAVLKRKLDFHEDVGEGRPRAKGRRWDKDAD
ncbi:hypothetical protein B0O99DRAFT_666852 [Bisporella sp. PMI_857]|nr:hypothetical protein B0O99DRAFT_666852 [Bisporella sp. PMI_857]